MDRIFLEASIGHLELEARQTPLNGTIILMDVLGCSL
jgi:hypothetical protein